MCVWVGDCGAVGERACSGVRALRSPMPYVIGGDAACECVCWGRGRAGWGDLSRGAALLMGWTKSSGGFETAAYAAERRGSLKALQPSLKVMPQPWHANTSVAKGEA